MQWGKAGDECFCNNWKDKSFFMLKRKRHVIMLPGSVLKQRLSWHSASGDRLPLSMQIVCFFLQHSPTGRRCSICLRFIPPLSKEVEHQDPGAVLGSRTALRATALELRSSIQVIVPGALDGSSSPCPGGGGGYCSSHSCRD